MWLDCGLRGNRDGSRNQVDHDRHVRSHRPPAVTGSAGVKAGRTQTSDDTVKLFLGASRARRQLPQAGMHVASPHAVERMKARNGLGLALGNWASVLVLMGLVPGLYLYRIHEEDAVLLAAFGDGLSRVLRADETPDSVGVPSDERKP